MTVVAELIGILGYKVEGEAEIKKFNAGLDKAEGHAKASADRVRKLGIAAGAFGAAAMAVTTKAVVNFAGFEREMNRIGITAGATASETGAAAEQVQQLAKNVAMPIEQAVRGLDTLVASGMDLKDAMAFLPSVLATAQAAGASTEDIANTAQKAASALKIEASQLQRAFDIMVAGGKAGQFELKDMAQFIPELANTFASLGYKGEEGLQKLIALMQTLREDTGSSGQAATQLRDILIKMNTQETAKRFEKFGIDLRESLEQARAKGEDVVQTFVRLSKEAINGDLTKLPLLFGDKELLLGMQSLMTSADSYKRFVDAVNGSKVDGSVMQDLNRILNDTQSQIDRLGISWDRFMKSLGGAVGPTVGGVLDHLTEGIDKQQAVSRALEARGLSFWQRQFTTLDKAEYDRLAAEGGYKPIQKPEAAKPAPSPFGGLPSSTGPQSSGSNPALEAQMKALASKLQTGQENLSRMTAGAGVNAVITDSRQDNRQFPTTVNAPVTVNVQQPTQAPAAVGSAVGRAVGDAAVRQRSQYEVEPAF